MDSYSRKRFVPAPLRCNVRSLIYNRIDEQDKLSAYAVGAGATTMKANA